MPRIVVLHRGYGCDTGCCGHAVEVDGVEKKFEFDHPHGSAPTYTPTPEDIKQFIIDSVIQACGEEHVADIDFEHCIVLQD